MLFWDKKPNECCKDLENKMTEIKKEISELKVKLNIDKPSLNHPPEHLNPPPPPQININPPTQLSSDKSSSDTNLNVKSGGRSQKRKNKINFSKIKWGSFTKIYKNYLRKHPSQRKKISTLKSFAHYVNKHPNKFSKKIHKKAIFYTNILEKKK